MMVNSLGVVYIVVHLEKKGKNKKEDNKRKKHKVTWNVSAFGASPLSVMS